jgi:chromosome segregation ATPase
LDKAKAVLKHHEQLNRLREARQALLEAQLVLLEAKSDVAVLNAKNMDITQKIQQAKDELKAVEDELKMRKDMAKSAQAAAAALLTVENKEEMAVKSAGKTVVDIDDALHLARTKLEVIQANNPQALEEYERYAERIRAARTQQERQDGTLAELNARIDEIKSQWEPRLDALVGEINDAFSYNFEQISCAGEVAVHKDEDFDRWAIEIRVKFRENETLQRLDQHRQSGGERAVSTIFYLMALQSMAQAPFRVVDEINQGMDPRNERMVHERMVEVACREHTSQYFLITPKLLSGLRYDERMRVHTIVSGENVDPRGTEKMDFRKFARIQRSLVGR